MNSSPAFPDLSLLFSPRSVILVGASGRAGSIGRIALDNIAVHGRFEGELHLVNPARAEIDGRLCYRSVADIPGQDFDVALVVVPAGQVLTALRECAAKGVRFAIVVTSGFAEIGAWGVEQEREMRTVAREAGLRIYGPNCPGLTNLNARIGLNISPSFRTDTHAGPIGLVTQGGGLGRAVIQCGDRGYGVGLWGSTGNEVDLDFCDLSHHMLLDARVQVIAGIVEGFKSGPRFVAVAKAAMAAGKPIVLLKVGRSAAGIAAAQSHTASMAGEDAVNDAVFRQYGVVRVDDINELHQTAAAMVQSLRRRVPRSVCVATFSGGAGTLAADLLSAEGVGLAILGVDTATELTALAPDFIAIGNPVDLTTQIFAQATLFGDALDAIAADAAIDAIVLPIPADYGDITLRLAQDICAKAEAHPEKLFVPVWMSDRCGAGYDLLQQKGILVYRSTRGAARVLRQIAALDDARTVASAMPADAFAQGPRPALPRQFDETTAKSWLAACGVAVPRELLAADAAAAGRMGAALGGYVAVKIVSPDIAHKSDVGGVTLGVSGQQQIAAAAEEILARVGQKCPHARIDGLLVSEMIVGGIEMVIGIHRDAVFGPMLSVGFGGVFVEIMRDVAHLHLPVTEAQVAAAVASLRASAVLDGARGRSRVDRQALAASITRIAAAAYAEQEQLAEVEVNPLIVGAGAQPIAVDALLRPAAREARPA